MIFEKNNNITDIYFINLKKYSLIFLFLILLIQIIISSFSYESILICFMLYFTTFYTLNSILNKNNLLNFFFPSLLILSLNFTLITGPLIFKTFFIQNLTSNLFFPYQSFSIVCIYQILLIFCLRFVISSKKSLKVSNNINLLLLRKLKIFNIPNIKYSLLILIIFSVNKFYLNFIDQGSTAFTQIGDVRMKFLYAAEDFFYLPIIFFSIYYFKDKKISGFIYFLIIIYYILSSIIFGLASNSRQEILSIFFVILSVIIVFRLFYLNNSNRFIKSLFIFSFIFLFFFMESISTVIIKSRSVRDIISSKDLLILSIQNNQTSIEEDFTIKVADDETYTGNDIVDRFIFIKFIDKSLYLSNGFTETQRKEFKEFVNKRLISILPINVIKLIDKNFDKQRYIVSNGSLLEKLYYGNYIGGLFNTGSFIVELIIITNSYLFTAFIIFILNVVLFIFIQSFQNNSKKYIQFSPILFVMVFHYLFLPNSDNSSWFFFNSIRRPLQLAFLYLLINLLSKNQSLDFNEKKI